MSISSFRRSSSLRPRRYIRVGLLLVTRASSTHRARACLWALGALATIWHASLAYLLSGYRRSTTSCSQLAAMTPCGHLRAAKVPVRLIVVSDSNRCSLGTRALTALPQGLNQVGLWWFRHCRRRANADAERIVTLVAVLRRHEKRAEGPGVGLRRRAGQAMSATCCIRSIPEHEPLIWVPELRPPEATCR